MLYSAMNRIIRQRLGGVLRASDQVCGSRPGEVAPEPRLKRTGRGWDSLRRERDGGQSYPVSAADTLQMDFATLTAAACTPAAGAYTITASRS